MLNLLSQPAVGANIVEHRYASSAALDTECASWGPAWLNATEWAELVAWRNPRRRQEWRRGRMLAKQLVADGLSWRCDWQEIEILRQGKSRRPRISIYGEVQPWSLSISHSARGVLVALSRQPATVVGVDLTDCEPLSPGFVRLWFTAAEVAWLHEQTTPFAANIIWATKEALFKACNRGEGFDPRRTEVLPRRHTYRGLPVDCEVQSRFVDDQVAVVVAAPHTPSIHSELTKRQQP